MSSLPWHLHVLHDTLLGPRIPNGEPGIRDIDHPCESFDPGEPSGRCMTDGHYMCEECRHLDLQSDYGQRVVADREDRLTRKLGA